MKLICFDEICFFILERIEFVKKAQNFQNVEECIGILLTRESEENVIAETNSWKLDEPRKSILRHLLEQLVDGQRHYFHNGK